MKIRKNCINPDNSEYAGPYDNDHHRYHTLPKALEAMMVQSIKAENP